MLAKQGCSSIFRVVFYSSPTGYWIFKKMLSASQLSFIVLLAAFQCQTQARRVMKEFDNGVEGRRKVTKCGWNCKVIESDLPQELKKGYVGNRFISVSVIYGMKVDQNHCDNKTFVNSSRVANMTLRMWHPENKRLSSFSQVVERVFNLLFSSANNEAYREIKVDCNLTLSRKSASINTNSAPVLPEDLSIIRGHLADLGVNLEKNITDSSLKCFSVWADANSFVMLFASVVSFYLPAFLCLFTPTVVTENGARLICLEGASPICFGSLIGNYFSSEADNLCHRTKKFIARVLLVPLLFLIPAIWFHYIVQHQPSVEIPTEDRIMFDLTRPSLLAGAICYFFLRVYDSFFDVSPSESETPYSVTCFICQLIKSKPRCNANISRRISNHLRMLPLILATCYRLYCEFLVSYFKMFRIVFPSGKVTKRWFLRVSFFIVFLSMIPFAVVILLVAMLVAALACILLTSPMILILLDALNSSVFNRGRKFFLVQLLIRLCAINGVHFVLFASAFGFLTGMSVLVALLFSEEGLSYLVCFVLVWYYLSSSYKSFTNKYHDLSLTLFKFYKQSKQHDKIFKEEPHTDLEKLDMPNSDIKGYKVRIPEGLFDMACEELMPIRESFCFLLLKVAVILIFVFYTFLFMMHFDIGALPVLRALAIFFTGSFPKILSLYFEGDTERRVKATVIEEKVSQLVQEYLNGTPVINEIVAC